MRWLKELWQDVSMWPGQEYNRLEKILVMGVIVLVAVIGFAVSANAARPHLDNYTEVELCAYRAQMTEIVVRYWNTEKRDVDEFAAMILWHGDETQFERAAVLEYIQWALKDFIPRYVARRVKEGKPVSTLITYKVAEDAYQECISDVMNEGALKKMGTGTGVGALLKVQSESFHHANTAELYQRAADALHTAYSKEHGLSAEMMIEHLNNSDADPKRYAWIMEYINSIYADEGAPWLWFLRNVSK